MKIENIRSIAIGIAVMIILPLLTNVGISLFIKEPLHPDRYESYTGKNTKNIQTKAEYDIVALAEYSLKEKRYQTTVFYIKIAVGILTIFTGVITSIPFLGMGFILGGVICLTDGYIFYWNHLNDLARFVSLLLALIILILSSIKFTKSGKW